MYKKLLLLTISSTTIFSQINHQDKIVIKRPLGSSTLTFDFDGRVNETGFFHKHLDLGIHYPIIPTWTIGLKYRAQYRFKDNNWNLEQRPQLEILKAINNQKIKIQLRSRMDYRIRDGKNDEIRNRSRIQFKVPRPMTSLKITPFISEEFFFAPKTWNYYINWTAFGFDLPKTKIGKPTIFYKYVNVKIDGKWEPSYTFVFKLTI